MSKDALSFLSAANPDYVASLFAQFQKDPRAVDASWAELFSSLDDELSGMLAELTGASWTPDPNIIDAVLSTPSEVVEAVPAPSVKRGGKTHLTETEEEAGAASFRAYLLIRSYQVRGHTVAQLDPLGMMDRTPPSELDPETFGFTEDDYDREIYLMGALGLESATLREILKILKETYCGSIGAEFMHVQDLEEKKWLMRSMEGTRNHARLTRDEKKHYLSRLTAAEGFEKFLDTKFTGTKRFGVDGGESVIPAIEEVITHGATMGVEDVVIGMAHRGRLNVLTNVMTKPFSAMFSEFLGTVNKPENNRSSGDVKYHMGLFSDRKFGDKMVHLSLMSNPSHLEFIDPVVIGRTRARQSILGDTSRTRVMPILLHGDAAVSGQGIVMETLMMSQLHGYRVGGAVHVVINNQIGFTTMPLYSRSGNYCTDVAKMVQAPIFHVNGDDVDAVIHVARMAAEYRQTFHKDVFIDVVCYRRHGHNEGDEPAFTQPLMYKEIRQKTTTRTLYAEKLVKEGVMTQAETDAVYAEWNAMMEEEFEAAKSYKANHNEDEDPQWEGFHSAPLGLNNVETGISNDVAQKVGKALVTVPEGFDLNSKIARQLKAKAAMFETEDGFDWGTAEALAFGSLVYEGWRVRLSGQDSGRGTFSQRHAVWSDQQTEEYYLPLRNIDDNQATFAVHDSPLSEAGVLGFEYGYSTAYPQTLVVWEAQFGDFANGAQVIIDQFLASAEAKWLRMSGLVMLLPHGFEGQGPEHSSGRLERFLQLSAEDNWQVVNCTTPANYFHALRRQMHRDFRKPLIVMTPKSLLRHKRATSSLSDMMTPQKFQSVLPDTVLDVDPQKVRRVVLCSGKVYYDLLDAREAYNIGDIALVRVEQLYPFPAAELSAELKKYAHATSFVWCQEEPENQGAWTYMDRRIESVLHGIGHTAMRPLYAGRAEAASVATGTFARHKQEQDKLVQDALEVTS